VSNRRRLDLKTAWQPVAKDAVPNAACAYADAMQQCPMAHVDGMFGSFWAVLGNDAVVKAAHDTSTFSNVVPLFGTRRPPLECDPPRAPGLPAPSQPVLLA
jgi:hypothetical protein